MYEMELLNARAAAEPELATFTYHDVTDDQADSGFQRPAARRYKLPCKVFAEHLDAIGAAGSPELIHEIDCTASGRHRLLTFDDGGSSALTAADALLQRGWRGHFFVVTRLIGDRRFLSVQDLRYLQSCGHVIGSHSHTHPDIFRDLSPARMDEEWRVSADVLTQLLGESCATASVPGGDISRAVLEAAAGAGFRYLFTSEPWLRPHKLNGCWILGRYCPTTATPTDEVAALARFRGWRRVLLLRQLKDLARRGLPTLYRHYVRVTTREFGRAS